MSQLAEDFDPIREIDDHTKETTFDPFADKVDEQPEEEAHVSSSNAAEVSVARPMSVALQSMENQDAVSIPPRLSLIKYAAENYPSNLSEADISALASEWDLDAKHLYVPGSSRCANRPSFRLIH